MFRWIKKYLYSPEFQKTKNFLGTVELFQGLGAKELGILAKAIHTRVYHQGESLFEEGDTGRALFILESGQVDLLRQGTQGKKQKIISVMPGGFFGEMALLEQLPRTASAVATEKSRLYLVYRAQIDSLLQDHPHIGVKFLLHLARLLSARLRRATASSDSQEVSLP